MTIRSRTSAVLDQATSFPITLPAGVQVGDRLLVFFSHDNATNVASTESTGWIGPGPDPEDEPTWRVQEGGTTNLASNLFSKVATGSDALVIDTTESQEAAVVVVCLEGDGGAPTVLTESAGTSSSSGGLEIVVPTFNGTSGDYDSVVFLGLDANPPRAQGVSQLSNYSTVEAAEPGGSGTLVGSYEQHRSLTSVSSISPGTLGWDNSEQSIVFHVVVEQASGPTVVEQDANDDATGSDSATVDIQVPVNAEDSATGSDSAVAGIPKPSADTATTNETWSADAEIGLSDPQQGIDDVLIDADLDAGTDPAEAADAAHIIIPADDEAGEGPWSYHVDADLGLTEPGTGADGVSIETLFGDLVISIYAVDPDDESLTALPDFVSLDISPERNSRGSISLQYPADGQNFALLRDTVTDDRDLEVEIWSIGSSQGALRGYLQQAEGDFTAETPIWTFAGGFLELRMDEAVVFPQDLGELITDPDTGEQIYSNAKRELIYNADSPGAVMATILDQAQDRGALDGVTWDFDTEVDSNGTAWSKTLTAKFSPGSTYTQILDKLVELDMAEWAIVWDGTDRVLKLWEPDGRGVDRTTGDRPIVLRRGRNIIDAPQRWSIRESSTTMLSAGSEGVYQDTTDDTALARRGRRIEAYSSLNNASDEDAVLAYAQAQLALVSLGTREVTHGIGFVAGEPRPIVAFDVGDWVYSQIGTELERLRVVQWTLKVSPTDTPSGTVTLNDTITDALTRLQKQVSAISAGEEVVGTSEPSPQVEDRTPPAAPQGVAATSIAYQDPEHGPGQTLAMVTVGWQEVTTNADGADSPLVQAAVYILDKMEDLENNPPDPEDPDPVIVDPDTWTWEDCPQVVQDFAGSLRELWVDDGSPSGVETWLTEYVAEASQTPTAADDVAGYQVRYAYIGLEQVGGIPSSDPFPEEDRVYIEATPTGGVTGTSFSFGSVQGGANIRIEVRAFDRAGNFGAWSSIGHDTANDTTAPPVPSAPTGLKTWFTTLDIPWDGLGAEGESMPVDFSHARVWVSQGDDFTVPAEPVEGPVAFDPDETGPQYVANLYAAGTWNVPDLPYDVGWFAGLQTVDHTGNASALGEVVGPVSAQQLVSQDLIDDIIDANKLGPDSVDSLHVVNGAITTAKIVDAAIVTAKIADLAVNNAKIQDLNVGKLTAGTMSATVTISGQFRTSASSSANRVEFDAEGIRLFRGSTLVGDWNVDDGDVLITGTYRSGLSGQRIHIDPDGTMSFYAQAGANASRIINEGNDVVWRGPLDGDDFSGRLNVNGLGVGINYSKEGNLLNNIEAEIVVLDKRMRLTAPFINFNLDGTRSNPIGGVRRIQFDNTDDDGDVIARSIMTYEMDPDDYAAIQGNGAALVFASPAQIQCKNSAEDYDEWINIHAAGYPGPSSRDVKREIEDARAVLDPIQTVRNARARKYRYKGQGEAAQQLKFGIIADELPEELIVQYPGDPQVYVDLASQLGVLWGAMGQVLDQEIRTVHASVTYNSGVSIWNPNTVRDVVLTWDSEALDDVRGALARMDVGIAWQGKLSAVVKEGSVTNTGCVVTVTAHATVAISSGQPLTVHADGVYLYTPPYVPPEEE